MRELRRTLFILFLGAALLLCACSSGKRSSEPMRLGLNPWVGFAPLYAAADQGLYNPVRVELAAFSTFYDIHRAFHQGRLELAGAPLIDALQMIDEGQDLRIVLMTDYSNGADALIARKSIPSMRDLRGKRVGLELGTFTHFVFLYALKQAGMVESDVVLVNTPPDAAVEDFKRGKIDAVQIWEPYVSKLRGDDTHALFSTAEIPGAAPDVLLVRKDVLERRREDVVTVLRAWNQSLSRWRTTPERVEGVMARTMEMSVEELKKSAHGAVLLDLSKNLEVLDPARKDGSLWQAYEETAKFMIEHKLLKSAPRPAQDIIDARLVTEALQR